MPPVAVYIKNGSQGSTHKFFVKHKEEKNKGPDSDTNIKLKDVYDNRIETYTRDEIQRMAERLKSTNL